MTLIYRIRHSIYKLVIDWNF